MTDLRTRLADFLYDSGVPTGDISDRVADLLSLPGIYISERNTDPAAMVLPDGWSIQLTNATDDAFCHCRTAIKATRPDGRCRRWLIPDRLLRRKDLIATILEELCAEVAELPNA